MPLATRKSLGRAKARITADAEAIAQLKKSARDGKLVAVIGTGVSMALTDGKNSALSWKGLIENGFAYGVTKGKITAEQSASWKNQLNSNDLDELLGAAEFMGRKLLAPDGDLYARWLETVFKNVEPLDNEMARAVRVLHAAGVPFCTLNYDHLLERTMGLTTVSFKDTSNVTAWVRRENPGVLHLHGSWDSPSTCILGIRDYETTLGDDVRDLIQRALASFNHLLFLGCGDTFSDPNFSALIKWLREKLRTAAPQHYALVSEDQVSARNADPAWHGFVEPISFGKDRSLLPAFLLKHFPPTAKKATSSAKAGAILPHAQVIQDYRAFLLKDCGQMTIEGLRADMDIGQRKFDLERLFVPLKVLALPPEIPATDPKREKKLLEWQEKNKAPLPFGQVFADCKRLALLALPGGGKTLLLKRLTVAYADPSRREVSSDSLPDLDLMPVLIRCREWRDHIRLPILTLLQNIATITGQLSLAGLSDALISQLKRGRVLLLVDGLDEIHNDADRSTFVEHLEAFLGEYKLVRLVVTSREAGFSLVAPCLARFCERWRVAPLEEDAVTALCGHWQRLMSGESPKAAAEGRELARSLLENNSLRRLAENPLLLTMLLVVKHGAGRLPPDRVSLYGRAVEVLLDTWNIKGHEALNLKEAIPQLAFIAFQMMRVGKQTATEKELLSLLEEAHEKIPQIRRYSTDTPDRFIKRVELRSSLIIEAGHQMEAGRAVPFYQFRHLTFQEYLAAVAAVEGHYLEYQTQDTVLTPLRPYITAEEWREVIPMAAVLARKQAEPLMAALVSEGNALRQKMEKGEEFPGRQDWGAHKMPAPVARLVQCLAEEAEASPAILPAALQIIALFAKGGTTSDNWSALIRGPYGQELLHQTWLLYARMDWRVSTWLVQSFAVFANGRQPEVYWRSKAGKAEIFKKLRSQEIEEVTCGLMTVTGWFWGRGGPSQFPLADVEKICEAVEPFLFRDEPAVCLAATWAWAFLHEIGGVPAAKTSTQVLDRLLGLWLSKVNDDFDSIVSFALSTQFGLLRNEWRPELTTAQKQLVRLAGDRENDRRHGVAALMIAFHARDVWPDDELAERLSKLRGNARNLPGRVPDITVVAALQQLGDVGQKYLTVKERKSAEMKPRQKITHRTPPN